MEVLVLDGPMGTELSRRGVATPAPGWSAGALEQAPHVVAEIHRAYAAAGATVHAANTWRTHARAVGTRWRRLLDRAVQIARESVPPGHRVAGSIGPLEDCYRPELSPGAASRLEHRERVQALVEAGVDLLMCETFANPAEAIVAVEECVRSALPTWVSLTAGPETSLMTPGSMLAAGRACVKAGATAVLVNCTPASRTLPFVEQLAELSAAIGAYANAGDARDGIGWGANPIEAARAYGLLAERWLAAGATIVGGCCGTGPEHVAALAALRERHRMSLTSTRP